MSNNVVPVVLFFFLFPLVSVVSVHRTFFMSYTVLKK